MVEFDLEGMSQGQNGPNFFNQEGNLHRVTLMTILNEIGDQRCGCCQLHLI